MTDVDKPSLSHQGHDSVHVDVKDGNVITQFIKKSLDVNKYATKKTIAQGLLDVALLTANASQLKYVLQVGEKHEFYTLMLTLISISIILQVTAALLSVFVSIFINSEDDRLRNLGWIFHHISLGMIVGILFSDIIRMNLGFDPAVHFNSTIYSTNNEF